MITGEMEAMLMFRKHKQTIWDDGFTIGGRLLAVDLPDKMAERGLVERVNISLAGSATSREAGGQYRISQRFDIGGEPATV